MPDVKREKKGLERADIQFDAEGRVLNKEQIIEKIFRGVNNSQYFLLSVFDLDLC